MGGEFKKALLQRKTTKKKKNMEASRLNKLSMYQSVNVILLKPEYQTLWASIPGFVRLQAAFKIEVDLIAQSSGKYGRRKTGVAEDKDAARKAMCKKALVVAGGVAAYAYQAENRELFTRVDTKLSILMGGRGKDSRDKCSDILTAATENLAHLAEFEVTQEDLDELKGLIDDYDELAPQPQLVKGKIKGTGQMIEAAFDRADGILTNALDNLMLRFEKPQPAFFRDYMNARTIIDRPGGHGNGEPEAPTPPATGDTK
jgi:hypothetical protein